MQPQEWHGAGKEDMMDKELIWKEEDGTLGFGDYTLAEKSKVNDFEFDGDLYKVKTYGMFVYESVPGTAVGHFQVSEKAVVFDVASGEDAQITLELEPEKEYKIFIDETNVGKMKTNLGGKLVLSIEKKDGERSAVRVVKCV